MSTERPKHLRPPVPAPRAGAPRRAAEGGRVDLVKHRPVSPVSPVSLSKTARPVSLVKAVGPVSLVKAVGPVVAPGARASGASAPRPAPTRIIRIPVTAATATTAAVTRAAGAARAWTRRPAGQLVLPFLLMAVLVLVATVTGALLPRATGAQPAEEGTTDATDAVPSLPPSIGAFPIGPNGYPTGSPGPSASGTGPTHRPADALAAWAAPMSVKTGVPVVALQAYAFAELAVAYASPTCNLRWTTLAGIGYHESNHGRSSGSTLTNDGRTAPPIYGPVLDGRDGRREIRDTDGGQLDGDRTFDRAVGPMQFIPSTWTRYAIDADRNGVADPHDLDDAALAAGMYLCAGGRDLNTIDGWWASILRYNNVTSYAQNVFTAANDYGVRSRA